MYIGAEIGFAFATVYTGSSIRMADPHPARRYRFGVFEADASTGELRKQGVRIKLNTQPFQVLVMLLERPGELLTRDEIARELWPDGTVVDYEHGVNSAINRIREALGDTAANPRFVQTLARRGYRFVAPVERVPAEGITGAPGEDAVPPATEPIPAALVPAASNEDSPAQPLEEPELGLGGRILAKPQDLPRAPHRVVLTLFVLFQLMYLAFYVGALANLGEIDELLSVLPKAILALDLLIVSAVILIPVRAFILCLVLFRAPGARKKFLKIWPLLVVFDELWALSPFLLMHHINFGLGLACMALLAYSPFAQRSLVLMGAGTVGESAAAR